MQFLVSKWSLTLFFLGVCLALTWRRSYFRQSALSRLVSHPLVSLFLLMASFLVCDCLLCIRPLSYSNGDDIGYMGLDFPAAWDSIKYSKRPS